MNFLQAALAIRAYHGLKSDIEIDEQIIKYEEDGQRKEKQEKNMNNKRQPNGLEIMFMPWKANDSLSIVIRFGAWIGIMVKVNLIIHRFLILVKFIYSILIFYQLCLFFFFFFK